MLSAEFISKRFEELDMQIEKIENTRRKDGVVYVIDAEMYTKWFVNAENIIVSACGKNSVHYANFIDRKLGEYCFYQDFLRIKAVFRAAKEDFDGGYCRSITNLVRADFSAMELDQAKDLLNAGYVSAAAIICGVVLESNIRQFCIDRGIAEGKLDKMNADLAKSGLYNTIVQKRITWISGIRNSAAHGKNEEFNKEDVSSMISSVEDFLSRTL